jgi:hypothetical protein
MTPTTRTSHRFLESGSHASRKSFGLLAAFFSIATSAGVAFAPCIAHAQDKSAADLRADANAALAAGNVPGACVLFEQSYQAAKKAAAGDPGPKPEEVLFDLADCHERQGYASLAGSEFDQVAQAGGANAADAKARAEKIRAPKPVDPPKDPPPKDPPTEVKPAEPKVEEPKVVKTEKEESPTRIGDFMDTRLTWTFGDDDVIHETGQAFPLSPNPSIGDRKQYRLFFDNLNSRFGGRENLTHLALYKKMPGFIEDLDTEASLVLRLDIAALATNSNNVNQVLYDAGSYIRAFYHVDKPEKGQTGIGVTLWPIDTDRFRLGYLYDISWGGTNAAINQSIFPRIVGSSPGGRISFEHPKFNVFVGFKTATIVQVEETLTPGTSEVEQIRVGQTNYGILAGGGADFHDYLRVDGGFGYFTQGKFDLPDVEGEPVYTLGGSLRLVVHDPDAPVAQSIDYLLYRNDPNKPQQIFKPEKYVEGQTVWSISAEGSVLGQNLKDFDVTGATKLQLANAVALQANLKSSYFRASVTGIYRDLPFVLRNQPSFIPFQTLPENAEVAPELFFAAAADYYIAAAHLTPGIGAGLQIPSTFSSTSVDLSDAPISRTVVVRDQGNIAILPVNEGAIPIVQARASLKWDISPILSTLAWVQYVWDNNGTFVERDPNEGTVALRTFISPHFFGLGTSVQARF